MNTSPSATAPAIGALRNRPHAPARRSSGLSLGLGLVGSLLVHALGFVLLGWMTVQAGLVEVEDEGNITIHVAVAPPVPQAAFEPPAMAPVVRPDVEPPPAPAFEPSVDPLAALPELEPVQLEQPLDLPEYQTVPELAHADALLAMAWSQGSLGVSGLAGGGSHGAPHALSGAGPAAGGTGVGYGVGGTGGAGTARGAPGGQGTDAAPKPPPVVTAPQLVARSEIEYPRLSRRLGEQGTVEVRMRVAVDGSVAAVELVKGSGFARLDEAALAGVALWRFEPAKRDGVPFVDWYRHLVTFQLEGGR